MNIQINFVESEDGETYNFSMNGKACLSAVSTLVADIFDSVYNTDDEFKGLQIEKSAALFLVSAMVQLTYKKPDFDMDKFFAGLKDSERMYYDAMNYGRNENE